MVILSSPLAFTGNGETMTIIFKLSEKTIKRFSPNMLAIQLDRQLKKAFLPKYRVNFERGVIEEHRSDEVNSGYYHLCLISEQHKPVLQQLLLEVRENGGEA